jgi:DNA-binding IclR family transcriptional regulator
MRVLEKANKVVRKREVPAVTRAVRILRQLGRSDQPQGVNQLARTLGIVPSTCLHILRALQDEGLVEVDAATKRYRLGLGVLGLARLAMQRNTFTTLIQPRLNDLSARFGVTAVATQLIDRWNMVVVALSQSNMPFRVQVDLGSRFPALISSTGRCLAAFDHRDGAELRDQFQRLEWDNPPRFDDWLEDVEITRKTGFGIDKGNYISGVTTVAVPYLESTGRVTRSIVALGISDKVREIGADVLARALMETRDDVARLETGAEC